MMAGTAPASSAAADVPLDWEDADDFAPIDPHADGGERERDHVGAPDDARKSEDATGGVDRAAVDVGESKAADADVFLGTLSYASDSCNTVSARDHLARLQNVAHVKVGPGSLAGDAVKVARPNIGGVVPMRAATATPAAQAAPVKGAEVRASVPPSSGLSLGSASIVRGVAGTQSNVGIVATRPKAKLVQWTGAPAASAAKVAAPHDDRDNDVDGWGLDDAEGTAASGFALASRGGASGSQGAASGSSSSAADAARSIFENMRLGEDGEAVPAANDPSTASASAAANPTLSGASSAVAADVPLLVVNWTRLSGGELQKLSPSASGTEMGTAAGEAETTVDGVDGDKRERTEPEDASKRGDEGTPVRVGDDESVAAAARVEDEPASEAEGDEENDDSLREDGNDGNDGDDEGEEDEGHAEHNGDKPKSKGGVALSSRDQLQQDLIEDTLSNFEAASNELFEQGIFAHTTERTWLDDIATCEAREPDDYFGVVGYPKFVGSVNVEAAWDIVTRNTQWSSVNALKGFVAQCNRGVVWKMFMAMEVENLALQMQILGPGAHQTEQAARSREAALQAILNGGDSAGGEDAGDDGSARGPGGGEEGDGAAQHMNVLDQIVAMAFQRMPVAPGASDGEHYETLAKKHLIVKQLWVREFGALPSDALWKQ